MALLEERTAAAKAVLTGTGARAQNSLRGEAPSRSQSPLRGEAPSRGQNPPRGQIQPHKLSLINRETMAVTGVKDVLAFDVSEVLLETDMGMLAIRGSDLHVNRLTLEKGEVDVTGKIDSMTYSDVGTYRKQGESLFGRLFR